MHYVYVLKLSNGQYYAGSSGDLRQRILQHKNGKVQSTRHRRPITLVFYEAFLSKEDALRRENYFKTSKGKTTLRIMLRNT